MKNETTNYKGLTPPTNEELKKVRKGEKLETYDIHTSVDGVRVHIKTSDKNLFNLYLNDEMTDDDTRFVMYQMEVLKEICENELKTRKMEMN